MVCEHFKANQGQGSKNSFIPLYHANFIASCCFNTGTDEMQGFSLSVLIPFFPLIFVVFAHLKVQFSISKPSKIFVKVFMKAL